MKTALALQSPQPVAATRTTTLTATFNGKFYTAGPTAVHRVAEELIGAIDRILQQDEALRDRYRFRIACPRGIVRQPAVRHIAWSTSGLLRHQLWEQLDLPRQAREGLLVNLCNLGPISATRAITMIHDAQVFSTPRSYPRGFAIYYRTLLPLLGRRHARILTVSEHSRRQLASHGVAPLEKIAVIHNGVDHMLRSASDPAAALRLGLLDRRFVVAVANPQRHKNIGVLLRAFGQPALRDLRLVLVGRAGRSDFAAAGCDLPQNVSFTGWISDGALRGLYEAALCVAMPSTTEGFGLPPLEGMAVGCPAVVAPCGALPEICADGALYADPDDAGLWADTIASLAARHFLRDEFASRARTRAAGFTWDRAGRALLKEIEAVTATVLPV